MKKIKIIEVIAFLTVVAGISILSFTSEDKDFSENENRILAKAPKFSWDKVLDCSFQEELEEYLKDQVCFRDGWISVKTFFQKSTGNTDIGGAYVGKEGYDFEKITPDDVDDMLVRRNTKAVSEYFEYCEKTIDKDKINFIIVPTSGLVYEDKLPKNAVLFDQNKYIDQISAGVKNGSLIDSRKVLLNAKEENLYYKTDHHWTIDAAFLVSNEWRLKTGKKIIDKKNVTEEIVTTEFKGSLYSKILDIDSKNDCIKVINRKEDNNFSVVADGKDIGGFYQEDKLKEKDKYAYFFGGNYGEVVITNKNNKNKTNKINKNNLLVIKDSFANSYVPLIAEEYDKIFMIDLRYYAGDMGAYLEENNITEVMVLYNVSNFISDKNIFKLTKDIRSK